MSNCHPFAASLLTVALATGQDVAREVADAEAAGLDTAVCVIDVDAKQTIYQHEAGEPRLPASNQKLLTAIGVLDALGVDYRFHTGFEVAGGHLVVHAGGDPNWFLGGPVEPDTAFGDTVGALRSQGVHALRSVRLDAGAFGGPIRPDGWPADQFARDYCAPTGGLVLEQGCWAVEVAPGGDHDAFVRVLAPNAGLRLLGRITMTADKRAGGLYHIEVDDAALRVRGQYWTGNSARTERGAAVDPAAWFARSLERALAEGGVEIDARAPALDVELPAVTSPLRPALARALKDSSNFDAEQLLRTLGAETRGDGSFSGGAAALTERLTASIGELPDALRIVDGSGLSRDNRVTAGLVARLLCEAAHGSHAADLLDALPTAGSEGTMRRRFDGTDLAGRVRAKTGTLSGVSALSGYLYDRKGRLLAFSILMAWSRPVKGAGPHERQERIVAAFDRG